MRSRFPTLGHAGSRQDRRNFCSILSSCFLTPDVCGEVPVAVTVRALSRVQLRAKAKVSVKTRLFTVSGDLRVVRPDDLPERLEMTANIHKVVGRRVVVGKAGNGRE